MTHTESCGSSCTAIARSLWSGRDTAPRPYLDPGGPAIDPSTSPVDEAWLAGGDQADVIRATGLRDGWTEDEVLRAQAKVTSASARKRPPDWLHCLERATEWVDVAPLPSPVAEARMLSWARDLLLARVSRVPNSARLEWARTRCPSDGPAPGTPPPATLGAGGLKRKREMGECRREPPDLPAASGRVELRVSGTASDGPVYAGVPAPRLRVKSESPSYSPVPGEDSVAAGYTRVRRMTMVVPTSAQDGPSSTAPPIWSTPALAGATI